MNFENFIQVEKEYHNKTTAVRWSERALWSYSDSGSDERYSFTRP